MGAVSGEFFPGPMGKLAKAVELNLLTSSAIASCPS